MTGRFIPATACLLVALGGCSRATTGVTASKYPTNVHERALCLGSVPTDPIIGEETDLIAWLEATQAPDDVVSPEYQFGTSCDRATVGPVDWSTERVLLLDTSPGSSIERVTLSGPALVIASRAIPQCGGAEMPMPPPAVSVLVVPAQVETVEWRSLPRERCDWEKRGEPPPP